MAYADLPNLYYIAAEDREHVFRLSQDAAVSGFPSSCVAGHPDDILPAYREGRTLWRVYRLWRFPHIEEVPGGWAAADRAGILIGNYQRSSALAREYVKLMRQGQDHQGKGLAFTLSRAVECGYTAYDLAAAERNEDRWKPLGFDGYQSTATVRELSRDL